MFGVNNLMADNLFGSILDTLVKVAEFGETMTNSLLITMLIALGLFVLCTTVCLVFISRTYESKLFHSVVSFNRYFKKNQFINEDNLVEVNNKFKQVPKTLRYSWQEYMLNRDRQPSEYINSVTCIDQPTRSSSYKNISNTIMFITIMISVLTTFANFMFAAYFDSVETLKTISGLYQILLVPLLILFIGLFIVVVLKLMESSRYADLYYEFHEFERYLNRACSTMPSFVDYEVLFDAKEIKEAIPVLQEYLEKRALQEQREAEEARHPGHVRRGICHPDGLIGVDKVVERLHRGARTAQDGTLPHVRHRAEPVAVGELLAATQHERAD